jgi:ubiquinone/menaquinone biosynthesis C-methylase UbiE
MVCQNAAVKKKTEKSSLIVFLSGANLKYYPKGAHLVMVEPNEYYKPLLKNNLNKHPSLHLERLVQCSAENMKMVPDESVDAVVSTIVLCSIDNIPAVLTEIKRVLVPVRSFFLRIYKRQKELLNFIKI